MQNSNDWRVYTEEDENDLNAFCEEHGITRIADEFYFTHNNIKYRISRYAIKITDPEKRHIVVQRRAETPTIQFKAKRSLVKAIWKAVVSGHTEEEIREALEKRGAEQPKTLKVKAPRGRPKKKKEPVAQPSVGEELKQSTVCQIKQPVKKPTQQDLINSLLRRR